MNNNLFDIIIIGAGPGGLSCAKELEKTDLKVLLIEKNKIIGPKVCAGGVTAKDLSLLHLPKKLIEFSYKKIITETPNVRTDFVCPEVFTCTIDRAEFGQWQKSQLQKTAILTGKRVVGINHDSILIDNGDKYCFKYLVGADGSNSMVRRHLKIKTKALYTGIQYIIPRVDFDTRELVLRFSDAEFSYLYGWIFPHRKNVSVGTAGLNGQSDFAKLKKNLENWISNLGVSLEDAKFESHSLNVDYRGYEFGNVFLIGDAAGLISAFTGEGIYSAIVSGAEVARKIINPKYKTEKLNELIKLLNLHRKTANTIRRTGGFRQKMFDKVVGKFNDPDFVSLTVKKFF